MDTVFGFVGAAAKFLDLAWSQAQVVTPISAEVATKRLNLIRGLQEDLDELARRAEDDLARLTQKAAVQ